jgi:hypothetical protein
MWWMADRFVGDPEVPLSGTVPTTTDMGGVVDGT